MVGAVQMVQKALRNLLPSRSAVISVVSVLGVLCVACLLCLRCISPLHTHSLTHSFTTSAIMDSAYFAMMVVLFTFSFDSMASFLCMGQPQQHKTEYHSELTAHCNVPSLSRCNITSECSNLLLLGADIRWQHGFVRFGVRLVRSRNRSKCSDLWSLGCKGMMAFYVLDDGCCIKYLIARSKGQVCSGLVALLLTLIHQSMCTPTAKHEACILDLDCSGSYWYVQSSVTRIIQLWHLTYNTIHYNTCGVYCYC
jgi:hypothetical protein